MKVVSLPTLTRFAGNVGQEKYNIRKKDESDGDVIPPPMEVIEDLMGFPDPFHHTKLDLEGKSIIEKERRKLL
eukprot:7551821-Ditylum_brightwellii.AAC.1